MSNSGSSGASILFRLPLGNNFTTNVALVKHGSDVLGNYIVQGNATEGKYLEIAASSFSTYSCEATSSNAVAKIEGQGYETLAGAITAVSDGQTITMLGNATEDVTIADTKNFKLDLAGNTLTASSFANSGVLEVTGGTIAGTITNNGTLTMDDGTVSGITVAAGTVNIIDGTVSTLTATAGVLNIKGGKIAAASGTNETISGSITGGYFTDAAKTALEALTNLSLGTHKFVANSDATYIWTIGDVVNLLVYDGSATGTRADYTIETWENHLANEYPNAVAIVSNTESNVAFANSTKNVIIKYSSNLYICPNFVLTDLSKCSLPYNVYEPSNFYAPYDFVAETGSYSRSLQAGYNSACVPFDIKADAFGVHEILAFSTYSEGENTVYFNYANSGVNAGVAAILVPAVAKDWNVTFDQTEILGKPAEGTSFKGVFVKTAFTGNDPQYYAVYDDASFAKLDGNLYPFRACFTQGGQSTAAPRIAIMGAEEAQQPTSLDQLNAAAENCKFILNGELFIRKNGHIFNAAGQIVK